MICLLCAQSLICVNMNLNSYVAQNYPAVLQMLLGQPTAGVEKAEFSQPFNTLLLSI